jgi:hypothetical protein
MPCFLCISGVTVATYIKVEMADARIMPRIVETTISTVVGVEYKVLTEFKQDNSHRCMNSSIDSERTPAYNTSRPE